MFWLVIQILNQRGIYPYGKRAESQARSDETMYIFTRLKENHLTRDARYCFSVNTENDREVL